ncbi:MAG: hypothetical protein IJ217_03250 [Clostridia bacterium]|nr:hypothetical protein [Clostridia bacterium]
MGLLSYMLKRVSGFDKKRFEKHVDIISKNTGKSKIDIKLDFLRNFVKYGCGYTDYFRGDYINLTDEQKKTFVTAKSFYKILHYLNDSERAQILSDKIAFNHFFKEFLKRDFIDLRTTNLEEFEKFLEGKEVVFAKVIDSFGGHGVSKILLSEYPDKEVLLKELIEKKQFLCEEALVQSDELNEINPNAINSFRVVTLYKEGKAYVLNNALRVNQDASEVIGSTNDLYFSLGEDGKIDSNVVDDYGNIYEAHPLTGKRFSEVQIHGVKEAFEMCKEAALKLPEVRYIGWDVAFTNQGPAIIEGNEYPGYGIIQFYRLKNSKTGHRKEIEDVLGEKLKI